jgi:hypothetical protein
VVWTGLIVIRIRDQWPVAGSCDHDNEASGSVNGWEIL